MEKSAIEITMISYLVGELDPKEKAEFEQFLKDHPEHASEFESLKDDWKQMDEVAIKEPSEQMDDRFFEMLHSEIRREKTTPNRLVKGLSAFWDFLWRPQPAYAILLVGIGLGMGYFLHMNKSIDQTKTVVVADGETEQVREQLVLTLLEQPSANKRLQGVNEVNKIEKVDKKVIEALLQTLNNDANVNVRLAAIEALVNYVENPLVRQGLIQAIVHQESPIVQITLADLMVALQEKKSIEPFKTLMRTKELNSSVKQKLENSIEQII